MPVLVAHASRHGSTQGVAECDPAGCGAFVIGSAVYASRWMALASEFIRNNGALLPGRPAWLSSVGSIGGYLEGL